MTSTYANILGRRMEKVVNSFRNFSIYFIIFLWFFQISGLNSTLEGILDTYEGVIDKVFDGDVQKYLKHNTSDIHYEREWDYIQSAFFASTVLTTIGMPIR